MTRKTAYIILPLLLLCFVTTANAQTTTTTSAQTTTDRATKLKEQMQLLQDQKKEALDKIRADAAAAIQTKREEFKTSIQAIKDLRKKALVERIDARLAEVNKNQTARFAAALVNLQAFFDRIKQSASGATALADVATAQSAIDAAKVAVDAQSAKVYTMTIKDETTLRANAGATVSQLRLDLMAVHKLVIDAKQAVQKIRVDNAMQKREATNSANL